MKKKPKDAAFRSVDTAVREIRRGRMVIVVDDKDRENEGDLVMAAERVTPAAVNFMAREARGLICVPMLGVRLDALKLHEMVVDNTSPFQTAFTVSVDAKKGVTTGISARDRARTVEALLDPRTTPEDLVRPGHVFPLRAKEGGVLRRAGQTEASVDLARLAGLTPAGVICEIMKDDGAMARLPYLTRFAAKHRLRIVTVAEIIRYRLQNERLVERVVETTLPTAQGEWRLILYRTILHEVPQHHLALVKGTPDGTRPVLVRVHSECLTGDALGSLRCDCGDQLRASMHRIEREGSGMVLYMRQEGRGIGLANKLHAYALQDRGLDTVEANERLGFKPDLRDYGIGAQMLLDLGVRKLRILTNNPKKIIGLESYGLSIVERVPIEMPAHGSNRRYLKAKRDKLGHWLELRASPA